MVWFRLATLPFLAFAGVALARVINYHQQDSQAVFPLDVLVISGMIVAVLGLRLRVRHRPSPLGRAMMRQVGRSLPPAETPALGSMSSSKVKTPLSVMWMVSSCRFSVGAAGPRGDGQQQFGQRGEIGGLENTHGPLAVGRVGQDELDLWRLLTS